MTDRQPVAGSDRARTAQLGARPRGAVALPGLDPIGRRFANGLCGALCDTGARATVAYDGQRTATFDSWKQGQGGSTAVARFQMQPLKGGALVTVPLALLATLIDRFYGGDGGNALATDHFGPSEERFLTRLAVRLGEAMATAWAPLPIRPGLAECGAMNAELVFGQPGDDVVVLGFTVAGADVPLSQVDIVMPLPALRGLAALQQTSPVEVDAIDSAWRSRLHNAVMEARLPLRTVIARPTLSVQRLMTLAPGDVIPVCLPARVPVTASGRLFAHGSIGEANGRAAIRIERIEHGGGHD